MPRITDSSGAWRGGQDLLDADGAVGIVDQRKVGKGSADVDAEAIAVGHMDGSRGSRHPGRCAAVGGLPGIRL